MKKLLAFLLILALFLLPGCGSGVKTFTDSAEVIDVEVNREFIVALGSNITTGYSWQPKYDSTQFNFSKRVYKADDNTGKPVAGSGGTEYFYFTALQGGNTQIVFTYYRPWETPKPQDKTQTFLVRIK